MARLSAASVKRSATIKVKGEPEFPMPDKSHARNALARLSQAKGLSKSQKQQVVSRAYKILGTPVSERHVTVTKAGRIAKK